MDKSSCEDIPFFNCELDSHCWSRGYIYYFMIGSWLFSYGDRVIMRMISLISVTILHVRSFMAAIDRSALLVT